ncbi:MAG: ZIP family metal transporter [Planctomycetota bacterium]
MTLTELLLITFLAALATDLATGLGVIPFFFLGSITDRFSGILTATAAGMMTAASLVLLVGEGLERTQGLGVWEVGAGLLAGAIFFAIATRWVHQHEDFDIAGLRESGGTTALLIVAAMTIHSLPEGVAVGVSFGSAHGDGTLNFGWVMALAIAIHNIPEGTAIAIALRARGISVWKCVGWAIFSSLPQPIAAVPAAWLVWLFEPLLPAGMGFAAGAMMYLVLADLIPEARKQAGPTRMVLGFFVGLVLMIVLARLVHIS